MSDNPNLHLKKLFGQLGDVVCEMTKVHFSQFCPDNWTPSINAFLLKESIEICVDLAGIDKSMIELRVEPTRLLLQGRRPPLEPVYEGENLAHILAMEIDCGTFERVIPLAPEVDPHRVTAEQRNGLLWIHLPLRSQA
jgi:HSP20 family protein